MMLIHESPASRSEEPLKGKANNHPEMVMIPNLAAIAENKASLTLLRDHLMCPATL